VKSRSDGYSLDWSEAEHRPIDTAVDEWRKHHLACVRIVGQHFKQFYCRQLKKDNWMNFQPQCQKCEQNIFLRVMLIEQSYRIK